MVKPIIPQPLTNMGYGSMDFLKKFKGKLKDNKAPISQGGSFMQNAAQLTAMNGSQRFDTGEISQGAQELAQKVNENEKTGLMQRTANLLQRLNQSVNPYSTMYPGNEDNPMDPMGVPLVPGPDGQLINENLMKLTGGDPDEIQRRKEILQQNPTGNPYSFMR